MDQIPEILEGINFLTLHGVLTFGGCLLVIANMQLTSWAELDAEDPRWVQWSNRGVKIILALALLWSFSVVNSHNWDPFRPGIMVLIAIDLQFAFRCITLVLAIRRRERLEGPKGGHRLEDQKFFASLRKPASRAGRGSSRHFGFPV